jgi:NAD(P)-dependent dehydrogenase (short-subunit alcohol dehydrogenase family)
MTDTSRAVVITGAAGDLGRELCGSFLADGFTVYALMTRSGHTLVRGAFRDLRQSQSSYRI